MSWSRRLHDPGSRGRRRTLALLGASLCGACGSAPPVDRRVRLPLQTVPSDGRLEVEYDDGPVEIRRGRSGIEARSLLCTHFGCRVRWSEETSRYLCACHGGEFDLEGRPVAGPPERPLRRVPVTVERDTLFVGEP